MAQRPIETINKEKLMTKDDELQRTVKELDTLQQELKEVFAEIERRERNGA